MCRWRRPGRPARAVMRTGNGAGRSSLVWRTLRGACYAGPGGFFALLIRSSCSRRRRTHASGWGGTGIVSPRRNFLCPRGSAQRLGATRLPLPGHSPGGHAMTVLCPLAWTPARLRSVWKIADPESGSRSPRSQHLGTADRRGWSPNRELIQRDIPTFGGRPAADQPSGCQRRKTSSPRPRSGTASSRLTSEASTAALEFARGWRSATPRHGSDPRLPHRSDRFLRHCIDQLVCPDAG